MEASPRDAAYRTAGAAAFVVYNAETWAWWHYAAWVATLLVALEILCRLSMAVGRLYETATSSAPIPRTGRHLDSLTAKDLAFIWFNRLTTCLFTYQLIRFCWFSPAIVWAISDVGLVNSLLAFPCLFIIYDFFYTLFHKVLHVRGLYQYIHKHHHQQMAPTRGNTDAVNVHPFEFLVGEYLHWLSAFIFSSFLPLHIGAIFMFILVGGILASLNHTRFDVMIPFVYQVRYHDLHHWYPGKNFGQYIMLWDKLFGFFRPYPQSKFREAQE